MGNDNIAWWSAYLLRILASYVPLLAWWVTKWVKESKMVTKTDKKLAESMRSLGRAMFNLAITLDPPEPISPCEFCTMGWGGACDKEIYSCRDSCQELSEHLHVYAAWKAKQEK